MTPWDAVRRVTSGVASGVSGAVTTTRTLADAGLARPLRPDVALRCGWALARAGLTPAAACAVNAARFPREPAVIDDLGPTSFAELARNVRALSAAFTDAGIAPHDRVGVLCRNHREFVEATFALASAGADVVLLNTSSAAPHTALVVEGQGLTGLVYDEEFGGHAGASGDGLRRFVARHTSPDPGVEPGCTVDAMARPARGLHLRVPPLASGRFVLLTSGSTGAPKAAPRAVPLTLDPLVALLSRIPLHTRDVTMVASPLFHAWGFGHLGLGLALSSTLVLRRRFDAEETLQAVERHRVRVLVVVPAMLKRMVELPRAVRLRYDASSLEVVVSSGAHLPGALAKRFMDTFGDVLYNLYGSTEAAWAAIADPADLRAAPGTAGTPPWRTGLRIVDDDGEDVGPGAQGRILVRNRMLLEHGTDPAVHPRVGGFLATGDVGRLDERGRLFVEGRRDDMIVSGGENVYPQEVEELLGEHPRIADVAVVAVDDPEFGQRLRALVVRRPGMALSSAEVKDYVRDRLARYKVPREVRFLDALPHNDAGKLVRADPHRN